MSLLWMLFAANGGTAATSPQPANSQPEIVVTGSRVATPRDDVAANVTVLSRDDFEVEKPRQLADILRRVAGVHIDQVGGRGGTGSLYLRGADPNYTLVLVDGVRVNDPTNARGGSFDFSHLRRRGHRTRGNRARPVFGRVRRRRARRRGQHRHAARAARAHARVRWMPWAARTTCTKSRWMPAARSALPTGTSVPATRTRARSCAAINSTDSASPAASTPELGASATHVRHRRVIPRPRAPAFPDDSGGYEFAEIRDTEERDADEAMFGAGLNASVGDASFALQRWATSIATITSIHPVSRRASAIRSACRRAWSTPASRRYSATLTGDAEVLRHAVAGLRRRLAARGRHAATACWILAAASCCPPRSS